MAEALSIILTGAKGRMGQAIARCSADFPALQIGAQIDQGDHLKEALTQGEIVIDFSVHQFTTELLESAVRANKALVMGTTGHTAEELDLITAAAQRIPLLKASNFSAGVNLLIWLSEQAAQKLPDADIEVVEMHHGLKQDAPSGTARSLGEALAQARALVYEEVARHGREGDVGQKPAGEIGMHAVRGGDVVGEHTVYLNLQGERLELTHRATNRDIFARGALRAAQWLHSQKPGRIYSMSDVLGIA